MGREVDSRGAAEAMTVKAPPQRPRDSATQSLRYSRFVGLMRKALPLAAVSVLGVVLAYALYPDNGDKVSLSYKKLDSVEGDLTMKNPRLSGVDAKGNPYVITAAEAVQQGRNVRKVSLSKVEADLQYGGGRWANASASSGFADLDAGTLRLDKGLSLYTDSGYELHTEHAFAELKQNRIVGDSKVTGQGPQGTLAADRFLLDRNKNLLSLDGHVRVKMIPTRMKR